MGRLSVPVICGLSGGLAIPALQVVELLRALPEEWQEWADCEGSGLDPATTGTLADLVRQLADRIDLACIEIASEEE
ncbi:MULTISPECIES: DUF6213 family protein [Kitasatospora]|uniref:Uncharacterized protein n=1 Tax=Kitasatospora setae (strain ATCC 33774 / DSM 43861 / JCM 3304 / KCC A-0304 / NBRC 14216 / KM-6054) TaxID=452652 RepID=E4N5V2_KITSK|nr:MULTISPECIES: DUF6213 family protein [Kitasatospora]BAJ26583.1 hypothetical protein KSE_07430 [Kitasatospora setae KM-6054]